MGRVIANFDEAKLILIYCGHSYTYTSTDAQAAWQLRAINWRYRLPRAAHIELPVNTDTIDHSVLPRAINWRYRIPTEG